MKQFVIQIPENKVRFFTELIQSLGFVETKELNEIVEFEIPEAHKKIVRDRIKSAEASHILDWEEAKETIKLA